MTWNEFKSMKMNDESMLGCIYEPTDITCPKCGKIILKRTDECIMTYPAKNYYICSDLNNCDWTGIA